MPALGMAQETGKLLRWLKVEGDAIEAGEIVMEIETDKAIVEIEAAAAGTLAGVRASEGDDVPVGQAIAFILAEGETVDELEKMATPAHATDPELGPSKAAAATSSGSYDSPSGFVSPVAARIAAEHGIDVGTIPASGKRLEKEDVLNYIELHTQTAGRVLASPKARRLAREFKIELAEIAGTGPEGAVLADDVLTRERVVQPVLSSTWQLMADRVTQAWTQVPHFYLFREARADRMIIWRDQVKARAASKVTYTDLLIKLVAESLLEHPNVNATWEQGAIRRLDEVNVGIAVAVEDGLVVPVVHRAASLSLEEIAERRQAIVKRSQEGRLRLTDVQDGTFTISNLGMFGVDAFTAILNAPQAAIMAVGRISERVVAVNGEPTVTPTIQFSLAFDHRVVDGARGAAFLETIANLIEEPPVLPD